MFGGWPEIFLTKNHFWSIIFLDSKLANPFFVFCLDPKYFRIIFSPNFLFVLIFYGLHLLCTQNFSEHKILSWCKMLLLPNFIWTKFFLDPKFLLTQNFLGPINFLNQNFLDPQFCQSQVFRTWIFLPRIFFLPNFFLQFKFKFICSYMILTV